MGEGLTRTLEPKLVLDQLKPTEKARQPSRSQLGNFSYPEALAWRKTWSSR